MLSSIPPISPTTAILGAPVEPLKRLQIFADNEFEQLVEAWADSLRSRYPYVVRLGGAGDEGLDVVGFATEKKFLGPWDAFQCKRRGAPLTPSDAWTDIGKVIWYIARGHYQCPRSYAFACNFGIGTTLNKYLANSELLKSEVRKHWDSHIGPSITSTGVIRLEGVIEDTFENIDFSVFCSLKPTELLAGLSGSSYYLQKFGGGLPPRPTVFPTPSHVAEHEMIYVEKLRRAYESHAGTSIPEIQAIAQFRGLSRHFEQQRRAFYSAESLREFSKDTVPAGTFEALQQDVEDGVQPVIATVHSSQFEKLNRVLAHAVILPLAANPLAVVSTNADKSGICHQLANDERLGWDDHD